MQQNIVEEGQISSVNYAAGTVKVTFADRQNTVSDEMPMFGDYKMPDVGDTVVCLFLSNNPTQGYCLGTPHSVPPITGHGVYYQQISDDAYIKYDPGTKTLTLHAPVVKIEQNGSGS